MSSSPLLTDLSQELLCHILQFLPLNELLYMAVMCRKLSEAVNSHLRLVTKLDLCDGMVKGVMPAVVTDDHMHNLLRRCPRLYTLCGLRPQQVERRKLKRKHAAFTVPGLLDALGLCNVQEIETNNLLILEAILNHLPHVRIIGHFRNSAPAFPPLEKLSLRACALISCLHLVGVEVPELVFLPHLELLHLEMVRFTKLNPFASFIADNLKSFVMRYCIGPQLSLRYLALLVTLSHCPQLNRLEFVNVPFPGGMIQRVVEDSYKNKGFVNLKTLAIASCKSIQEADIGYLMVVSSKNLESLAIQPSLTRDGLFFSLSFAQCTFPVLKSLNLGYTDKFNYSLDVFPDANVETREVSPTLTDTGMKVISRIFPNVETLSVSNCPHLVRIDKWVPTMTGNYLKQLKCLVLKSCHCLHLSMFCMFLPYWKNLEAVILYDMFREPPKGCSHVGLSAGTGLGMSSAVVSNQEDHIEVGGAEVQRELIDPAAEENEVEEEEAVAEEELHVDLDRQRPEPQVLLINEGDLGLDPEPAVDFVNRVEQQPELQDTDSDDSISQVHDHCVNKNNDCKDSQTEKLVSVPLNPPSADESSAGTSKSSSDRTSPSLHHRCSLQNFDPDQPSTSKAGNCTCFPPEEIDLVEPTNQPAMVEPTDQPASSTPVEKPSLKRSQSPDEVSDCKKSKKSAEIGGSSAKKCNKNEATNSAEREQYQGPMTRGRTRKIEAETPVCVKPTLRNRRASGSDIKKAPISRDTECSTESSDSDSSDRLVQRIKKEAEEAETDVEDNDGGRSRKRKRTAACPHQYNCCLKYNPCLSHGRKTACVSEGTQANFMDIRRSLKKHRGCTNNNCEQQWTCYSTSPPRHGNPISATKSCFKSKKSKSTTKQNKYTSTSDPLLEDDAVQILNLTSRSLTSLVAIKCGISSMEVRQCSQLNFLQVEACRILKEIKIYRCKFLKRLTVRECPKLPLDYLVSMIFNSSISGNHLLSYEPCMQDYHVSNTEQLVLRNCVPDTRVILFHDFSSPSLQTKTHYRFRENIMSWMEKLHNSDVVDIITSGRITNLFKKILLTSKIRPSSGTSLYTYPWSHSIRKINGCYSSPDEGDDTEYHYQILTNDCFFSRALEERPWDKGFPAPGDYQLTPLMVSKLKAEGESPLLPYYGGTVGIYVPLSDHHAKQAQSTACTVK